MMHGGVTRLIIEGVRHSARYYGGNDREYRFLDIHGTTVDRTTNVDATYIEERLRRLDGGHRPVPKREGHSISTLMQQERKRRDKKRKRR